VIDAKRILGPDATNYASPAWIFQFRGRTVGAIVMAGFGAYSMYWWTRATIPGGRIPALAAIALIFAILFVWSIKQLSILRRATKPSMDDLAKARRKQSMRFYLVRFCAILTIEVAAIIFAGPILGHFHREGLFPQWVDSVVGVHFFPLARLFKLPLYYVTGLAILLAAGGSLLISAGSFRDAITAGGTGLSLWISSFIILGENPACLPANARMRA
jgi:hypothetical protein